MKENGAEIAGNEPEAESAQARPPYIIDTSVAIKWYIPEALSSEAKAYIRRDFERHAPDYLLAEAASVVLKRIRMREPSMKLTLSQGQMVNAALKVAPIQFHESRPLIDPAFALAEEIGSSLDDGLFLALTLRLDGQLITADEKLFKKIRSSRHGRHTRWIEDAS